MADQSLLPFAILLRNQRRAAGLTQAALAERATMSVRGLQHLEAGDAHPSRATVIALTDALTLSGADRVRLLAAASRTDHNTGRGDSPQLDPTDSVRPSLPVQLTPLLGREQQLIELRQLLHEVRLLTLTGTGGCGKTRLALQLAHDAIGPFADVWLVELAAVTEAGMVARALAQCGGIAEDPQRSLLSTCVDVLRSRHLLLVLDNCEHVLDACAHLADVVLRACPRVTILATSREPLRIEGERQWRVPSLTVPADSITQTSQIEKYGAVQLFLQRAAVMQPGFILTDRNAPAVAQICQRLDGIPLALELAAARLRTLGVEQLRDRLADQLSVLTGGSRVAPPRQQTLRATLDWSYRLLTEDERRVLASLAVFTGGFTLEAAESVCADPKVPTTDVLDLVTCLVDRSLVVCQTSSDESSRYSLLEIVRQYALARLQEFGEEFAARTRHASHYLSIAENAELHLVSSRQIEWLDRLEQDRENLRSALMWTVRAGQAETGQRLACALLWWWVSRGRRREGLEWLVEVLGVHGPVHPRWRIKALHAAGALAWIQGHNQQARRLYEQCRNAAEEQGDRGHLALALDGLGRVAIAEGEIAVARTYERAGLAIQRELGNYHAIGYALFFLGSAARADDDLDAADLHFTESLEQFGLAEDRFGQANALRALGDVARRKHDLLAARKLAQQSVALARSLGNREGVTLALDVLGEIAIDAQEYSAAHAYLAEGLIHLRDLGVLSRMADSLERFALLADAEGDVVRAARLVGAAAAVRARCEAPSPAPLAQRSLTRIAERSSLEAAHARAEGARMSLADAVSYALEPSRLHAHAVGGVTETIAVRTLR
ncbi:MAG: helix-turn-helix domain-containing protein [Chloroflexi bacterium]|nr:helix-turn-helix domain-containing protein [Chloroflexota bacterium]